MVRTHREEMDHRKILRQKYFEDPSYRRLSDLVPDGLDGNKYGGWRDDVIFALLVTGKTKSGRKLSELKAYLDKGSELPINWENLYAYFDEQLEDPENRYLSGITTVNTTIFASHMFTSEISLEDLLNQYRDYLTGDYDIV
jgi:hypothetical protein